MKMKKVTVMMMMLLFIAASANADIIGTDNFDYDNGSVAGQSGGTGWNGSVWIDVFNDPQVQLNILRTDDSGALRDFNSDRYVGAIKAEGQVYFGVSMKPITPQGWLGISCYDWDNERIFFGMPWNDGSMANFGVEVKGGEKIISDTPVELEQEYFLVTCLDFDAQKVMLWVDADTNDFDLGDGITSADVTANYTFGNWCSGVRCASGGLVEWDGLIVTSTFQEIFNDAVRPTNPSPVNGMTDQPITDVTVSWDVVDDADAVSYKLYMAGFDSEPNASELTFVADIDTWTDGVASYDLTNGTVQLDKTYYWRVDTVMNGGSDVQGMLWQFNAKKSTPIIEDITPLQIVPAGSTAEFTVTVSSLSPETYQWYKYVDGENDDDLSSTPNASGTQTDTLSISDAQLADEGQYYCVVNNQSGIPATSENTSLAIQRRIAYWPFENNSPQSTVAGSPESFLHGEPVFEAGYDGDAITVNGDDLIYTEPNEVEYFDICNNTMTVSCWVKTSNPNQWSPFVARNGEGSEGWQLRQHGNTSDKIAFTTRQTGNDDGTPSSVSVYDGQWHFIAGTYDGTVKKVYIDGKLSSSDDVSGLIGSSPSPIGIGGRVRGAGLDITFDGYITCSLDDVSIFNYALDGIAIAQAYANATGQDVCPENPTHDYNDDCVVDIADFAIFAAEWLKDNTVSPQI